MGGLLLLAALVTAQVAPRPTPVLPEASDQKTIVVTGVRDTSLERRLAAWIARSCPPEEEVALALALADALFLRGDLQEARRVVGEAIRRNGKHSRAHPVPIADLWRAHSRITSHLGDDTRAFTSVRRAQTVLRQGLGEYDPRTVEAITGIADFQFKIGERDAAESNYRRAIEAADRSGSDPLIASTRLRFARFLMFRSQSGTSLEEEAEAGRVLAPLLLSAKAEMRGYGFGAQLLMAQIAERRGARAGWKRCFEACRPRCAPLAS